MLTGKGQGEVVIQIYNTLSRRIEELVPRKSGELSMYICGPTVYNYIHIGNARTYVSFDMIVRFLIFKGYKLTLIRNITDVDDKIINKANQEGLSSEDVAKTYTEAFQEDMDRMGILAPDIEPKATEHIPEMVKMIGKLVEDGKAYEVDGDVYFAVDQFPDYGKLSNRKVDELRSGERIEPDPRKRNVLDFALWKAAKPGEPAWESPWGQGRPGWHIECSAMSEKYFGFGFDIHGGGIDLIFPHHENEIAQAEAASGTVPFVKYWMHGGMVNIGSEKMAKSVGNIILLRDLMNQWEPRVFRLFCLSTHYRSPIEFTEERMHEAQVAFGRVLNTLANAEYLCSLDGAPAHERLLDDLEVPSEDHSTEGHSLLNALNLSEEKFMRSMEDDFGTPQAIGTVFELVKDLNAFLDEQYKMTSVSGIALLREAQNKVIKLFDVLGIVIDPAADVLLSIPDDLIEVAGEFADITHHGENKKEIAATVLEAREEARRAKDWATADAIRNKLKDIGILIEDTPKGPRWKIAT